MDLFASYFIGFELKTNKHCFAQFDIRLDEEQAERLAEALALLADAGYVRARIQHGLSPFDKLVGGLVWAIQTSGQRIDVDLLYAENATIGQKMCVRA
jgi:hypothetical protein